MDHILRASELGKFFPSQTEISLFCEHTPQQDSLRVDQVTQQR